MRSESTKGERGLTAADADRVTNIEPPSGMSGAGGGEGFFFPGETIEKRRDRHALSIFGRRKE